MCRNIRNLYNFEPSTTEAEIHDAALQYVRKVSGMQKPSRVNEAAFERAVHAVAHATGRSRPSVVAPGPPSASVARRSRDYLSTASAARTAPPGKSEVWMLA